MKILVTGASGFVGQYLLRELLASNQHQVFGTSYHQKPDSLPANLRSAVMWFSGDLQDKSFVDYCLETVRPDQIYHLAAFSSAGASFKDPAGTIQNNVMTQLHLLEEIRHQNLQPQVLVVGSVDAYGLLTNDTDVDEDTPFQPISPYGVSKVAQDYLALQYFLTHNMHIVRARPSNHIGPGQSATFVLPSFCRQIARIEKGLQPPVIKVGNLDGIRDFTDVRDMVKAYVLALNTGDSGQAYVIGSGQGIAIHDILDQLASMSIVKIAVEQDPALIRPLDVPRIVVDAGKLCAKTGWQPSIPLDKTLQDLLHYWREADKELLQ